MVAPARYSSNTARNGILRAALFDAWDRRCYFCRRWFDVAVMEIDHLLPRYLRFDSQRLDELLGECLPPELVALGFDIDAPHNLAPICRGCNSDKSDRSFAGSMRFTRLLQTARDLEPRVTKLFHAFEDRHALAKALATVAVAELNDPRAKETMTEFGALMVNRLRIIAPEILETPSDYPYSDPYRDELQRIVVTLDETGRRARVILEDVYGCDFDEALRYPIRSIVAAINARLISSMSRHLFDGGETAPDIADPSGRVAVEVTELVYESAEEFRASGRFEADGSSDAAIHANTDSGTAWVQVDAEAVGTFSLYFAPDDDSVDPGSVHIVVSNEDAWCDDPGWKEESYFALTQLDEADDELSD
ncbi:hypothetical protein VZC37_20705 [Gordonia sp. LSe1-13]|uniref:HNH endonuclease n=1 Tax=Gordonia sesuvii TaxID=3116777 RepID=A0ABU7MIC2_9ACTN|nr:hypothetical protein [Gordonia sp. LSe1-13]